MLLLLLVVGGAAGAGAAVAGTLRLVPGGWLVEAVLMSTLLAQRSLAQHVGAVAEGLERSLAEGRRAVARIVGRDPERLERAAVARAAIESLAENLSDGVAAPLFWGLLLGLPGMLAYKAINTADSMIGHKSDRYRHLGWASARLDDLLNLVPARLTGAVLCLAGALLGWVNARAALRVMRRDAPHHRSPNAGWPEAAMAAALGLRLAGPRVYGGVSVTDAWMGDGRADAAPADIRRGLRLAWAAWCAARPCPRRPGRGHGLSGAASVSTRSRSRQRSRWAASPSRAASTRAANATCGAVRARMPARKAAR